MSRLRLLLFWLLVLVIPVQGFAATSGLLCDRGGVHHHETVGPHAGEKFHSHDLHTVAQVPAHSHAASGVSAPGVDGPAHQCGLCAACCHAVAISHHHQPVLASSVPLADIPDIAAHIPSLSLRLPEKPPRA